MLRLAPSTIKLTQRRFVSDAIRGPIIGVDLGTFNSQVAVMDDQHLKVIEHAGGSRTIPSFVTIREGGKFIVGEEAKRQVLLNPSNTLYATKYLNGRDFEHPEIKKIVASLPYKVVGDRYGEYGKAVFEVQRELYSPEEVAASIISKLKESAESYLGKNVKNAVMTVPPYFNHSQIEATKKAFKMAGLNVLCTIDEPVAANLAYGYSRKDNKVTFDVSILEIKNGNFKIKSTNSDLYLGGEDFDDRLVEYLVKKFKQIEWANLTKNVVAMQRLYDAAEKSIYELSKSTKTDIFLPSIHTNYFGTYNMDMKVSRKEFEKLSDDLIQRTIKLCKKALLDSKLKVSDIDEVLCVGGMSHMPKIQELIQKIFGRQSKTFLGNPDEAVVVGAAIQGYALVGQSHRDIYKKESNKSSIDYYKEREKTIKDNRKYRMHM